MLLRLGVEQADLEDAVHDVFLVAHRRRDAFTGESSMRTWLLGICRRVAADHRRRHRRHRRRVDELRPVVARASEPDDTLLHHDGMRLLEAFLASLDDPKREIFVMVELEQLTGSEAARVLGLNRNTAAARLRAARRAFDGYARRLRCPPPQLLVAARRRPRPEPGARQRVLGALLVHLGDGGSATAPLGGGAGAGLTTAKAVVVSVVIAAAGLGLVKVGGAWAPSSPASVSARDPGVQPAAREHRAAVEAEIPAPVAVEPSPTAATTAPEGLQSSVRSDPATDLDADVVAAAGPELVTPSASSARSKGTPPAELARSPPDGSPGVDPLLAHSQALGRARAALRGGDASRALAIVDVAIEAHPAGALYRELALVRVEALCTQGRRARAREEAEVLRRTYRGSPVAERARCP